MEVAQNDFVENIGNLDRTIVGFHKYN